jgi:hypothetical protein
MQKKTSKTENSSFELNAERGWDSEYLNFLT